MKVGFGKIVSGSVVSSPVASLHPRDAIRKRQSADGSHRLGTLIAAILWLAGCGGGSTAPERAARVASYVDPVVSFTGGVIADEPAAAQVGRDVMANGGSAADAVAAMFFTLAVTYPSAAGLGGGGACVVYDPTQKKSDALDFMPLPSTAGGAVALPTAVRAMGVLQARYGTLRWEQAVAPAEQLARFRATVSRAYARVLGEVGGELLNFPAMSVLFQAVNGQFYAEGETFTRPDLAQTLSRIRLGGPGEFYAGPLATQLIADAAAAGGRLLPEALRDYVPQWSAPIDVKFGRFSVLLPPTPGGDLVAHLWPPMLEGASPTLFDSGELNRSRTADALARGQGQLAEDPYVGGLGSTGVTAMDGRGQAVACTLTNVRPFGLRKVGGRTGVLFVPVPGVSGDETPYLAPLVVAQTGNANQSFVAATGTGGQFGPAALVEVVRETMVARRPAQIASSLPRVFRYPRSTEVLVEPNYDSTLAGAFKTQGLRVREVPRIGQVNIMACDGLPGGQASCRFAPDPRGFGIAHGEFGQPLKSGERSRVDDCTKSRKPSLC